MYRLLSEGTNQNVQTPPVPAEMKADDKDFEELEDDEFTDSDTDDDDDYEELTGSELMESGALVPYLTQFLTFKDLQNIRLVSRVWFYESIPAWNKSCQIVFRGIADLKSFVHRATNSNTDLPYTIQDWIFERETLQKLMIADGKCEQELLKPFWDSVRSLKFCNWNRERVRREVYLPDPRIWWRRAIRRVSFEEPIRKASARQIRNVLGECENLTKVVLQFEVLARLRAGGDIGFRQFPQLPKLQQVQIYTAGRQFDSQLENFNGAFEQLLEENIRLAGDGVELPAPKDRHFGNLMTGGEILLRRILDHGVNIRSFSMDTGTRITVKAEDWIVTKVFAKASSKPLSPKMTHLGLSIPLKTQTSRGLQLQTKNWKLKSLYLRTIPGEGFDVSRRDLHNLICYFDETLEHLEILYMRPGESSSAFTNSGLIKLKSLELWGYTGDYSFVQNLKKLEKITIGAIKTDDGSFERARDYFANNNPIPNGDVQILPQEEFFQRLNRGIQLPSL